MPSIFKRNEGEEHAERIGLLFGSGVASSAATPGAPSTPGSTSLMGMVGQLFSRLVGQSGDIGPTLKKGSSGAAVSDLQTKLGKVGFSLKIDGQFGLLTEAAVKKFQERSRLPADGVVGPKTWSALDAALMQGGGSSPVPTSREPAPPTGSGSLKKGDSGPRVLSLQRALGKAGFSLKEDGQFGILTEAAVRKFQERERLPVSGVADPATLAALDKFSTSPAPSQPSPAAKGTLRKGDRGPEVSRLQSLLNNHGYALLIDGVFGSGTDAAVRKFQQSKGLASDGIVGAQTWAALEQGSSGPVEPKETVPPSDNLVQQIESAAPRSFTSASYQQVVRSSRADLEFADAAIAAAVPSLQGLKYFSFASDLKPILRAIAFHESTFKPGAKGAAGEQTQWQLLPKVVADLQTKYSLPPLIVSDPASVGKYLAAYIRDLDSFVSKFFPKPGGIAKPTSPEVASSFMALAPTTPRMSDAAVLNGWWLNGNSVALWADAVRMNDVKTRLTSAGLSLDRSLR